MLSTRNKKQAKLKNAKENKWSVDVLIVKAHEALQSMEPELAYSLLTRALGADNHNIIALDTMADTVL